MECVVKAVDSRSLYSYGTTVDKTRDATRTKLFALRVQQEPVELFCTVVEQ